MFIKLVGGILIITSTTGIGISYARGIKQRYKELRAIKQSVSRIRSDLEYGGASLEEIFRKIQGSCISEHKTFWQTLIEDTKKKGNSIFTDIWGSAVSSSLKYSSLLEEDKLEFRTLGDVLCMGDRKQQITMLNMYLESLDGRIRILEEEKDKKTKLYHSLGVVGGLFIITVLL